MKKYLKTALIACLAVCMIACTAVFATACTDTGKFEITLVYADDNSPAKGVMVNFCEVGGSCVPQATDENGKVTFDISGRKVNDFHIAIISGAKEGYEIDTTGLESDKSGVLISTDDGYKITLNLKKKA